MQALTDAKLGLLLLSDTKAPPALSDIYSLLEREPNQVQSAIQTPNARAAALATANQDIDAAKHLILSMLTHRNMLVPISFLPAEILARIFHFVVFSESVQPYFPTLKLSCVYFTHVCRRWRQVALDDSTLWTHFSDYPQNSEWIAEQLSRARNAPLVIDLGGWLGNHMFSLFTPHISHTRELYLRNWSFFDKKISQEVNIQKAAALERLELSMTNTAPMSKHHLFLKGPLPELRIFCTSGICFPWSLVPRVRLTQLKVTYDVEVPTSKASLRDDVNQLIDLLVNCPSLEVLTLKKCLPGALSKFSGGQTIHLPQLSQLCLDGTSSRITNLLKILKLPPSTTLCLNCTSENTATYNDYHILPFLLAHFNDPAPVKFRSFRIILNDDMGHVISMVASTSLPMSPIPHIHGIQASNDPEFSLSFHDLAEPNNRVNILRQACNVLSLSNLESLSIYSSTPNEFINWSKIFQHCTEVTTVKVSGCGTIGLLQALTPPQRADTTWTACGKGGRGGKRKRGDNDRTTGPQVPDDSDGNGPAPVHVWIFPKLTSLLLEELNFADAVPGLGVLYDLILSAVQRLKANEMPLTALHIDYCMIREKPARALAQFVRDFRWDHYTGNDVDKGDDREDYDDYNNLDSESND